MLYSYNQQTPQILPDKIRLSSGLTRTNKATFTAEEILDAGYVVVPIAPQYDATTQEIVWDKTTWKIVDLSQQELANRLQQEWTNIRAKRNLRIQNIDWKILRALSYQRLGMPSIDSITDLDMYIQALRDVTNQTDPYNIIWPTAPGN